MKVAYISDLHCEFREAIIFSDKEDRPENAVYLPETLDADVLIVAGDIHPNTSVFHQVRMALENRYKIPVIMVRGNHDYWNGDWVDEGMFLTEVNGLRIVHGTFWTELGPSELFLYKDFADFRFINGLTFNAWNDAHRRSKEALQRLKPDIVVTHHAPSYRSVSEEFRGNPKNAFFVSNSDRFVDHLGAKIWIHGHVHSSWDYMTSDTRVLCNPYGYPGEIKNRVDIKIVEV